MTEEVSRGSTIIIGITGLSGTGKGLVADNLHNIANSHDFHVYEFNLSDEIRAELIRQGKQEDCNSRERLIEVGNELRSRYGNGILARRVLEKTSQLGDLNPGKILVVVSGIRNLGEVEVFRKTFEQKFILLAVEASDEVRRARLTTRFQYSDDLVFSQKIDHADRDIGIEDCIEIADWRIENEGTKEQLALVLESFFEEKVVDKFSNGENQDNIQ